MRVAVVVWGKFLLGPMVVVEDLVGGDVGDVAFGGGAGYIEGDVGLFDDIGQRPDYP
ncbi:hypothetical protein [Actinomyces viscosus]|uniref:hypothetical protein n=1 Tax=Actinomyces viscosus TaxID=1656 RepID=UPI0013E08FE1|nr:hypothetical protein [Actinomyces viscosus]